MRKIFTIILTLFISFQVFSQINFVPGYFISNDDQKTEVLIKNMDWKNNPTKIEYKLNKDANIQNATIDDIQAFGINNESKYIRRTIPIDRSSSHINNMSRDKKPHFSNEQVFLKLLVEGHASLYEYADSDLKRYFYKKDDQEMKPLVYKEYLTMNDKRVAENEDYKKELWRAVKCKSTSLKDVENLKYQKNDLVFYFTSYNNCVNGDYVSLNSNYESPFQITVRPRINSSSLSLDNDQFTYRDVDFDDAIAFGIGLELEYTLPFNNDKWSMTLEPTYQSFKGEENTMTNEISGEVLKAKVDYSSIEIPLSVRHYFFLNSQSKIYLNASYMFDLTMDSSVEYTGNEEDGTSFNNLDIDTDNNFGFGLGYKYNNKYSVELKYYTSRNLLKNRNSWSADYNTLSLILGYSIFK